MKIRTKEQLYELISEDLGWRRHELLTFQKQVSKADVAAQPALLRASVALLYAHWEGFVKNCCHWYLCYLAARRLTMQQLRPELAAIAARSGLQEALDTKSPAIHRDFIKSIRERASERAHIPTSRESVRTASNLSFEVLRDVLTSVGCDAERYTDMRDLINAELVAPRNRIVHGEADYVRLSEWEELRDAVLAIMDDIADQVIGSAVDETFFAWKA